jgi:hypothetical protein
MNPVMIQRLLLITSMCVGLVGCRISFNPFTRMSAEPNFDRLIELEKQSSAPDSAENPVSNRRPGGSQSPDRHSGQAAGRPPSVKTPHPSSNLAPKQSSETEDWNDGENFEEGDQDEILDRDDISLDQRELLRQTQIALRGIGKSDKTSPSGTIDSPSDSLEVRARSETATVTNRSGSTASASNRSGQEGVVEFRFSDSPSPTESTTAGQDVRTDGDSSENLVNGTVAPLTATSSLASSVQPASHSVRGADVPVQHADQQLASPPVERAVELRWDEHLRAALQKLSQDLNNGESTGENPKELIRQRVIQRLLALSLDQREQMTDAVEGLQPAEQDYFRHQLTALMDAIDPDANPVGSRRWALVMLNQRKAHDYLATLSNLEISNLSFCTEVESFGVTERFPKYSFLPDQEVLLYCELDNFTSEKTKDNKGFETQLQGSYEIVDSSGRRVADQLLPIDSHICRNRRRDYFIAYRIYMPQSISAGSYTLRLTIEDIKGKKFGQSDIQFQIQ